MASFKLHSAKTHYFPDLNPSKSQPKSSPRSTALLPIFGEKTQSRRRRHRVLAASPPCSHQLIRRNSPPSSDHHRRDVNRAELERWVKGSVAEIVRNLEDDSPLVVEVYAAAAAAYGGDGGGKGGEAYFKAEKAVPDEWAALRGELEKKCPDGLIFVEQLGDGDGGGDRCWGILIQGRDCCAPVCYLLKTCRAVGMEGCCTHFSLVKVKSFRESAYGQFKNSWLSK